MEGVKPGKVHIAPVQQQQVAGGKAELAGHFQFVHLTRGHLEILGSAGVRIQQEMQFDRTVTRHKVGPREEAVTYRHIGGVHDFDPVVSGLPAQLGLQTLQQFEVGLCKDEDWALLIGIGQAGALHRTSNTQVIELLSVSPQAEDQVAQALFAAQLGIEHATSWDQ